jgi:HK97 family phage prohead protease
MQQQEQRKQANNTEMRSCVGAIELRQSENGKDTVFGYALKFGVPYDMGWFTEEIQRGALDGADLTDVRILFNHDQNLILGRTKAGTAKVGIDEVGMWYMAELPDSPTGQNVKEALRRGDIDQSSWAFSISTDESGRSKGDKWSMKDGKDYRVITSVRAVYDASPVTYPANPDTTAAKRSKEVRGEDYGEEMEPKAQMIEVLTELISEVNEIAGSYKECADKLTMIASVNPDLAQIATDTAAMITQKHDDSVVFINEIAATITRVNIQLANLRALDAQIEAEIFKFKITKNGNRDSKNL